MQGKREQGMSGEILGDLAQGALTARALEPSHGEGGDGHTHEAACLNCGTALVGKHCHECGQAAHVHRSLGAFFHDFLHGVFHFEGKIWRTIPALAFHPGRMTRQYIEGKRATYVSPIALFLFAVFLMFAVVKNFAPSLGDTADVDVNGKHIRGLEANRSEITRLEALRADLVRQGKPTEAVDGEIEGRKSGIKAIEDLKKPASEILQQAGSKPRDGKAGIYSDIPAINAMLTHARDNPQLALYQLQSNAYKFAWLLIPISVPFVWLLFFWKRRFGLYDHTVFVTYSLCFMMLLVSVLTLGSKLGVPMLAAGMAFIPPLHIYKQVRHAYGLTRFGALWRTCALSFYAFVALTVFLMALLALSGH